MGVSKNIGKFFIIFFILGAFFAFDGEVFAKDRSLKKANVFLSKRTPAEKSSSFLRLGFDAWKKEEFKKAQRYFRKSRKLAPSHPASSYALAHLAFIRGQYESASGLLLEALNKDPKWSTRNFHLALFFPDQDEFFQKRETLQDFVRKNPKNQAARFFLSYLLYFSNYRSELTVYLSPYYWDKDYEDYFPQLKKGALAAKELKKIQSEKPRFEIAFANKSYSNKSSLTHFPSMIRWYPLISDLAYKYNIDPKLVLAIIHVESRFNPRAVSPAGARGLMQLIPATARRFGVKNIYDPAQNVEGGIKYLRFLFDTFENPYLALAGYNAGEHNVIKHQGIPPFLETQTYVRRVISVYKTL